MIISTIVIAGTGVFGYRVFNGQLQEMKSASKYTQTLAEQAKVSADSAKLIANKLVDLSQSSNQLAERALDQAKAANQLARIAAKQSTIAEKSLALATAADRPWIGLLPPSNEAFEADKSADMCVTIVNSGKSPARIIEGIVACAFLSNFPKNPSFGMIVSKDNSHVILVPNTSIINNLKFPGVNIQPTINNFKTGILKFYVYSTVTYEDIRTHQTHHALGCFVWNTKKNRFVYSSEYNDAD